MMMAKRMSPNLWSRRAGYDASSLVAVWTWLLDTMMMIRMMISYSPMYPLQSYLDLSASDLYLAGRHSHKVSEVSSLAVIASEMRKILLGRMVLPLSDSEVPAFSA